MIFNNANDDTVITRADGYLNSHHIVLLVCKYLMLFCHETRVWHNTKWQPLSSLIPATARLWLVTCGEYCLLIGWQLATWSQLWMWTWHDNYIVRSSLGHMLHNFLLFFILFWQLSSSVIYAIQFFLSETKLIYFQQKGLNLIKCSLNCELWSIEAIKKLLAFSSVCPVSTWIRFYEW